MEYDADTLNDLKTILSIVEGIVLSAHQEIDDGKKKKVKEILEHPDRYYVDGDELLIHCENPILERFRGDIQSDIPFDRIKTVDVIGNESNGFFNAVYLEKTARFLFRNATKYLSSSAYYHLSAYKKALEERMKEEEESFDSLMFGFAYGDDLYTLEYIGDSGLDVYCATHPFGNPTFAPLSLALATIDSPMIEARYVKRLCFSGQGIASLSSFRQDFYWGSAETLLDECESLEELVVSDDCPNKDAIIKLAAKKGIKILS